MRSPARRAPPATPPGSRDRPGAARAQARRHRAAARRRRATPARPGRGPAAPPGPGEPARAPARRATKGWIRPKRPPRTTSRGLRTLTSPASPMPSQRPTWSRAASAGGEPAAASASTASTAGPAAGRRVPGQAQQGALADERLPAADRAAAAGRAVRVEGDVADLAAVAGGPGERPAVHHQPAADAHLAGEVEDVVDADGGAAPVLGEHAEVRLVGDRDRDARPERRGEPLPERDVPPAEVRRHRDQPVLAPDDADDRDPDPRSPGRRPGGGPRRRRQARRGRRRRRRPTSAPAAGRRAAARRPSPPSPTSATASESTAISRASTTPPRGSIRTSGDGRPGVPRRTAPSSTARPALASSPIRPRIALRVSPVRVTSSERDSGPPSCSARTIALRFARRTVSLRWPISSRPRVTGLCSSLPNPTTGSYTRGARVKMQSRPDSARVEPLRGS